MASSSNSSTTTTSSSFTPYTHIPTGSQPKKRLRLTQTSTEGVVEWTLDLHVATGAHVTCMPSGPHLLIEEVDNDEEPRRLVSSSLVRCIEDASRTSPNEMFSFENAATAPPVSSAPILPARKSENSKRNSSEDESEEDKTPSTDFMRAISRTIRQEREISPKELLREALFPQDPSRWSSHQPLVMPRVIREKLPIPPLFGASNGTETASSDIASPSTKASGSSSYAGVTGSAWTSPTVTAWGEQPRTMLVRSCSGNIVRPVRAVGSRLSPASVKKSWPRAPRREVFAKEEVKSKIVRPLNNEAAPKSRVHFTADGSIPVCRMPNCRRPMYFYKNEDRWRCNLNRGGCGAVFHNVGRDIGPCSKCQRPLGEPHPCYDWCVCRYCTSAKKHLDPSPTERDPSTPPANGNTDWSASTAPSPAASAALPPNS